MSIKLYDDALLAKFNKWVANRQTTLTGVNETKRLFETIIDKNNDKPIQLPLIALSRPGGYSILNRNKRPLTHIGATAVLNEKRGGKLNIVPISISYQIDIYTRYLEEADEYARNLVFNILNYPKLTIELPYENQHIQHVSNIRLNSDIEDNSDIPERLIPGQFTRLTATIEIDDAYLFDLRIRDNISISEIKLVSDIDN